MQPLPHGYPLVAVEPVAPFLERAVRVIGWADGTRHNDAAENQPNPVMLFIGAPHSGQARLAKAVRIAVGGAGVQLSGLMFSTGAEIVKRATDRECSVAVDLHDTIYDAFGAEEATMMVIEDADILFDSANAAESLETLLAASHDENTCGALVMCGTAEGMLGAITEGAPEFIRRALTYTLPDLTEPVAAAALIQEIVTHMDVTITDPARTMLAEHLCAHHGNARTTSDLLSAASQAAVVEGSTGADGRVLVDAVHLAGLEVAPKDKKKPGKSLSELMTRLDDMIGLDSVKERVRALAAEVEVDSRRREAGLSVPPRSRHLVFTGNPGTAKTTVARLIAEIYRALGVVAEGQLVETQRADLVAGYLGQTAPKTRAQVEKALGGVLFIDEAYSLAKGDDADFGQEAIDELLVQLENRREDFVVIVAGYTKEMEDFLDSNPGLRSRFGNRIEFPDYSNDELAKIYVAIAKSQDYRLSDDLIAALPERMGRIPRGPGFANGRSARMLFEQTTSGQSARLSDGEGDLQELTLADLPAPGTGGMGPGGNTPRRSLTDVIAELDGMIGLESVKHQVRSLATEVRMDARRKASGLPVGVRSRHLIFLGNPGTAKTTVARLIAQIYRELGVVSSGHLVECSRTDLIGQYIGQTAPKTRKVIESSIGGVLFIDEAYTLAGHGENDFGSEAIAELLVQMENRRDEILVIAAGYPKEMDAFLDDNPGMRSRFGTTIVFEDYTDDELARIFTAMATSQKYTLADDLVEALGPHIARIDRNNAFANGRTMRQLLEHAIGRQAMRLGGLDGDLDALSDDELQTLRAADLADD
ncbi:AAA family ATPase [Nocardia sp. NEAU-G5]|uniref:AAA family ATPase n=1 Tax=Nocardia albiluteola TaxID=2842303 RepID=A0ABS6AXW7_9NOCA|nr:AAA family ATPase [Nocardia albiluteola]MBU3062892.1 AAA family ATPase [Nocardia albiluteola]